MLFGALKNQTTFTDGMTGIRRKKIDIKRSPPRRWIRGRGFFVMLYAAFKETGLALSEKNLLLFRKGSDGSVHILKIEHSHGGILGGAVHLKQVRHYLKYFFLCFHIVVVKNDLSGNTEQSSILGFFCICLQTFLGRAVTI